MRLLNHLLGKPVTRRGAVVAAGAPLAAMLTTAPTHEPAPPAPSSDDGDAALAASELQGQLARTQAACLRLAQQLEARYVRYAWTEQLAADLRAIAHDTPGAAR